jgi:lipid-binding SYLF domain-containing protein
MRIIGVLIALFSLGVGTARAAITHTESDRLRASANVLKALHTTPDSDIPGSLWGRAECVVVIPSVKKVAFVLGGEYGKGVAMCRNGISWSAPAFVQLEKGSWGAQVGAEEIDLVLLVMNRNGLNKLLQDKVTLGAGASIAAGPVGRTARAATDLLVSAEIVSYSRSNGIFAGIDLAGGVLGPDNDANHDVYGATVNPRQILVDDTVVPPTNAASLFAALNSEATPTGTSGR